MTARPMHRDRVLPALAAASALAFVLLAALYDHEPLASLDTDTAKRVAADMPHWAEILARPFSWLGGWIGVTFVLVVVGGLLARARRWLDVAFLYSAVLGGQVLVTTLKLAFDRPRPHVGSAVPLPITPSFPSGHAATGVTMLGALAVLLSERLDSRRARAAVWAVAVLLAAGIGVSRIVLNVHYVTDVLAGWCIGTAWLCACILAREALARRRAPQAARLRLPA